MLFFKNIAVPIIVIGTRVKCPCHYYKGSAGSAKNNLLAYQLYAIYIFVTAPSKSKHVGA